MNMNPSAGITAAQTASAPAAPVSGAMDKVLNDGARSSLEVIQDRAMTNPNIARGAERKRAGIEAGLMDKQGKDLTGTQKTLGGLEKLYNDQEAETAKQLTPEGLRDARLARMYGARAGAAGAARGQSMLDAAKNKKGAAAEKIKNYTALMDKEAAAIKEVNALAGEAYKQAVTMSTDALNALSTLNAADQAALDKYLDRVSAQNKAEMNAKVQLELGKSVADLKKEIQATNDIQRLGSLLDAMLKTKASTLQTEIDGLSLKLSGDELKNKTFLARQASQDTYSPIINMLMEKLGISAKGSSAIGGLGNPTGAGSTGGMQATPTSAAASALSQYGGNMGQFGVK